MENVIYSTPNEIRQDFYPKFNSVPEVTHIQAIATKTGIIRTTSTFEGVVLKGVGKDYDWKNIQSYLTQGRIPNIKGQLNNEIIISK